MTVTVGRLIGLAVLAAGQIAAAGASLVTGHSAPAWAKTILWIGAFVALALMARSRLAQRACLRNGIKIPVKQGDIPYEIHRRLARQRTR